MEIEVRKIKVTKSVIQQIPLASLDDLASTCKVLGYCILPGTGRTPKSVVILLINKNQEPRKLIKPQSIEIKRMVKGHQVVLKHHPNSRILQLLNMPEAEYIKERIEKIISEAISMKQIYY